MPPFQEAVGFHASESGSEGFNRLIFCTIVFVLVNTKHANLLCSGVFFVGFPDNSVVVLKGFISFCLYLIG
jgi:hypothetical protein